MTSIPGTFATNQESVTALGTRIRSEFSEAQAQAKQNQALSMIMKPALRGFLFVREYDNIPRIVTHIGQNYGISKN